MRAKSVAALLALSAAIATPQAGPAAGPVRLPFHIKNGLILINGRVDATSGTFMLDTGETYFRFLLNRSYLPLGRGADLYKMHAESGQQSVTQSHAGRHVVVLADALTTTAESGDPGAPDKAVSDDFQQMMKNLDTQLLGVVGYAFLKQYDFTIDYRDGAITLYAPGTAPAFPGGVTIKFFPSSPGVPFPLKFGDVEVPTVMDTGGWEELRAPQTVWTQLTAGGFVHDAGHQEKDCIELSGARYGSWSHEFDIPHVDKANAQNTKLTLGYPFLRRYISFYSSHDGTVTLVPIRDVPPLQPESCE